MDVSLIFVAALMSLFQVTICFPLISTSSVFYIIFVKKKKLWLKKFKKILPTYPNFFEHITPNTYIFVGLTKSMNMYICETGTVTLSWRRPIWYRNQSIDLLFKSMDWFLYDIGLHHERVKSTTYKRFLYWNYFFKKISS